MQPEQQTKLADACREIAAEGRRRNARGALDADDVAQDACVRALDLPAPSNVRDPIRYLFRIARNLVIDRRRTTRAIREFANRAFELQLIETAGDFELYAPRLSPAF